jgi:hypothetical protein
MKLRQPKNTRRNLYRFYWTICPPFVNRRRFWRNCPSRVCTGERGERERKEETGRGRGMERRLGEDREEGRRQEREGKGEETGRTERKGGDRRGSGEKKGGGRGRGREEESFRDFLKLII